MKVTFLVILDHFLLFCPPNNPKNQNFEKLEKAPGDIIIWHICIIKDNQTTYSSWDMKHGGQTFLSFWTVFLSFYSPNNPKNQSFGIMKQKSGDIIIWHMCIINNNHMIYGSWDMKCDRHNFLPFWIFCHFGPLLPFHLPNIPTNQNFEKLKKTPGDFIILHIFTIMTSIGCMVPEISSVTDVVVIFLFSFFSLESPTP